MPQQHREHGVLIALRKYKHDRVWPIPTGIQEAMNRELDMEVFYVERAKAPQLLEWTPEHEISFGSYVDRMLKTPTKCPCGCGGIFDLPKKKETDNAQGNDEE